MKRNVLICLFSLLTIGLAYGQVYLDQFDEDNGNTFGGNGLESSISGSEWTITGNGSSGAYDPFGMTFLDDTGSPISVDMSGNNKIFARVKASSIGTQLRIDAKDANGFVTTIDNVTRTVLNDYVELEFEYTAYQDGGYGGTSCASADAPCPVDGTNIIELVLFINPGQGGFQGTLVFDYISFGEKPSTGPMSDVYQDQFEGEMVDSFISYGAGYNGATENGIWEINGDGTAGPWNPMVYYFHNMVTNDTADIDLTLGDNKIFVRAKGSAPGISLRCDAQDIDGFITTSGSVTKVLTDEWATYEYDLTGFYNDLGYGGTPCTAETAPCPVDATRIGNLTFFINPGVEGFSEQVQIEYISIGTALEAIDPGENVLVYGDHFNDGIPYTSADAFAIEEVDSRMSITGDGTAGAYQAASYTPFNSDTGETIMIDVTGNNKIFLKGSSTVENTLIRMDLIDSSGYITSLPAVTKVFGTEESVAEYDFSFVYQDGGYGGTPCEADVAPCDVDGTAIVAILLYPNPADGAFNGTVSFDYLSVGAPLGADILQYTDQFDNDINFVSDPAGFTSEEINGELILTGDGSAGPYAAYSYDLHDQDNGTTLNADFTLNNKLYVKAKTNVNGTVLRIDLQDEAGYASNLQAQATSLTDEYQVFEFDFTGAYLDGGYGGTPCNSDDAPCDVDGTTINNLLLYLNPDDGGFSGNVTIDWVSTQNPLETIGDPGPVGQDNYADDFLNDVIDNVSGADGLVLSEADGVFSVTGDGTSGMWNPVVYSLHNQSTEETLLVNGTSNNNLIFIRAKSSVDGLPFRVDVQDNIGYVTSLAGLTSNLSTEYDIYEFDYTGVYQDGGFGGTPCDAGPCDVDPERLASMQFFIDPGVGLFNGTVDIDWISFGQPLVVHTQDFPDVVAAKVFPNPVQDRLTIEAHLTADFDQVTVSIIDMTGRTIQSHPCDIQLNKLNTVLDLNQVQSGIYFLHITAGQKTIITEKLVIR